MAVSFTNLTKGGNDSAATSFTTASITPASNNLILVEVMSRRDDSTEPTAPSLSGCGLTWEKIEEIYFDTTGTSRRKLSSFRGLGASPTSGTITINFGSESQTDCGWVVDQASGIDTSGTNGSGAIVQSAKAKDESVTNTTITATLAAFSSTDNATYGVYSESDSSHRITPGSGFTELAEANDGTPFFGGIVQTQWKSTNDTSVDWTSSGTIQAGVIAIEIKAAATATTTHHLGLLGIGA